MPFTMTPRRKRGLGWKPQLPDARDLPFRWKGKRPRLARKTDLTTILPPVFDQGNIGTCVTQAVCAAMRCAIIRAGINDVELSRLQLYADARRLEGTSLTEDSGLEIRSAIKCANTLGVAHESLWPYADDPVTYTRIPLNSVYADALLNQALIYEAVAVDVRAVKIALSENLPVVFGMTLYSSFDRVGDNGLVSLPNLKRDQVIGGHAMLIIGYDDNRLPGYFRVRNSWGPWWGSKGDCFIPATYLCNPRYAADFWIIKTVEGFAESVMAKNLQRWVGDHQVETV